MSILLKDFGRVEQFAHSLGGFAAVAGLLAEMAQFGFRLIVPTAVARRRRSPLLSLSRSAAVIFAKNIAI